MMTDIGNAKGKRVSIIIIIITMTMESETLAIIIRMSIFYKFGANPRLFLIITLCVFASVTFPIILPHITNIHMIYHILLHLFSLIIAIFLATVSIFSFKKSGSKRVLFMSLGFSALAVVELL